MSAPDTTSASYSERLATLSARRWKRFAPNPYRWWLRHERPGFVLDVGCGVGRSLAFVDGHGVGIDHNPHSVAVCRAAGLEAFTPEQFDSSEHAHEGRFDSLLCSHVLEHLHAAEGQDLLAKYMPYLRSGGRVFLITPQERGYASDATHVRFVDDHILREMAEGLGVSIIRTRSFPLPRAFGRVFIYNEFVATGRHV